MKIIKNKGFILITSIALLLAALFIGYMNLYNKKQADASDEEIENTIINDVQSYDEEDDSNTYLYVSEEESYIDEEDTDEVLGYYNSEYGGIDTIDISELDYIDEETAENIVYSETLKFSADFFDYNYEYEVQFTEYYIYVDIYQLSENGNKTGNNVFARLLLDGSITSISIYNNEDESVADMEVEISESEVIDIAYKAVVEKSEEEEFEIYINEASKNDYTIELSVHDGQQRYAVTTEYYDSDVYADKLNLKCSYVLVIDANTGEVLYVTYYKEYIKQ